MKHPKNMISPAEEGKGRSLGLVMTGSLKGNIFAQSLIKVGVNSHCKVYGSLPTFQGRRRYKTWSCLNSQTGTGTSSEQSCSPTQTPSVGALKGEGQGFVWQMGEENK